MNSTDARGYPTHLPDPLPVAGPVAPSCPICRSLSTVTTSKIPDESSYWRCNDCGEMWNVSRYRPSGGQRAAR